MFPPCLLIKNAPCIQTLFINFAHVGEIIFMLPVNCSFLDYSRRWIVRPIPSWSRYRWTGRTSYRGHLHYAQSGIFPQSLQVSLDPVLFLIRRRSTRRTHSLPRLFNGGRGYHSVPVGCGASPAHDSRAPTTLLHHVIFPCLPAKFLLRTRRLWSPHVLAHRSLAGPHRSHHQTLITTLISRGLIRITISCHPVFTYTDSGAATRHHLPSALSPTWHI